MKPLIYILFLFLLNSCYTGSTLTEQKTIRIILNFPVNKTTVDNPKYIQQHTDEEYKTAFIESLKTSLTADNLKVVPAENVNADLTLILNKLELKETSKTEIIEDPDSEYNGQSYQLHQCEVQVIGMLYKGDQEKMIKSISISADKEEKVKNNRTIGDRIAGNNKDNNTYRQKDLSDSAFMNLSQKCGNRTAAVISKRVNKLIKKGKM